MKLKEPRSFSSSFIFFFIFLFFSFFLFLRTVGNTMHLLHLHPMLERLLVLKQWSDDSLMEWVHKNLYQFSGLNFGIQGSISSWKIEANRGGKGPPLLRIFLLRTLWCFPSLCFTEFCSWFHCFAVEINIYSIYRLWSRRCFTKRCFWLRVDIQRGLRCSRYRTHNAWIEWLAKDRYAKIRNGQLLSLVPKKINPELIHLKIILALWFSWYII